MTPIRIATLLILVASGVVAYDRLFSADPLALCVERTGTAEQVDKACTAIATDDSLPAEVRANAYFKRGYLQSLLNDPDAEAADYAAALELDPDHFGALHNLSILSTTAEDWDTTLSLARRASASRPDSAGPHHQIGVALSGLDRHEEAIASFDTALALDPDFPKTARLRAKALTALERYEDAQNALSVLLLANPDDLSARVDRSYNYARYLKSSYHALIDANRAVRADPDSHVAIATRGYALQRIGMLAAAKADYEAALGIKPSYSFAANRLERLQPLIDRAESRIAADEASEVPDVSSATFHFTLGRPEQALALIEEVLTGDPSPNRRFHASRLLARIRMSEGNHAQAIAPLEVAFDLAPDRLNITPGPDYAPGIIQYRIGNAHQATGDSDAALNAWRAGLDLGETDSYFTSLWQLRLDAAGLYPDLPDGTPDPAFWDALATCAAQKGC